MKTQHDTEWVDVEHERALLLRIVEERERCRAEWAHSASVEVYMHGPATILWRGSVHEFTLSGEIESRTCFATKTQVAPDAFEVYTALSNANLKNARDFALYVLRERRTALGG